MEYKNCGGNHPTEFYKTLDRIVLLQSSFSNYIQQSFDNCKKASQPPTNNNLRFQTYIITMKKNR